MAVVDAKYKAEKPDGFPRRPLSSSRVRHPRIGSIRVHFVYAKGNERAQSWTVRNVGVGIVAHTLDLERPPEDIIDQVDTLAGSGSADRMGLVAQ